MPLDPFAIVRQRRLRSQGLVRPSAVRPADVVAALGAVQAQDYLGAKWGLGLRLRGIGDRVVEDAFDRGEILRTHAMRPTWHFVTPADIRWIQALTGPRVLALNRHMERKLELDGPTLNRSSAAIQRALDRGGNLTRQALGSALERAGIAATGQRLAYMVMHAELNALICSGPRLGRQFTYALLDTRAPQRSTLTRDEALAELTRRFFSSHGPATVKDFVWWSGLRVRDARAGVGSLGSELVEEVIGDLTYWSAANASVKGPAAAPAAFLMPNYDEYLIAYRDRGSAATRTRDPREAIKLPHHLLVGLRVTGGWRRTLTNDGALVEVVVSRRLGPDERDAVRQAAAAYGRFLGVEVTLKFRARPG